MPHSISSEISQTDKEDVIKQNKKKSVSLIHDTLFFVNILRLTPLYRPQPISNLAANSPKIISKQQTINY